MGLIKRCTLNSQTSNIKFNNNQDLVNKNLNNIADKTKRLDID